MDLRRRMHIGAEVQPNRGVHFRVWAPRAQQVEVVLEQSSGFGASQPLEPEGDGYYSGIVSQAHAGSLYRFRLDGGARGLPDPASRFQPSGPHGPSEVIDPDLFRWTDKAWPGVARRGQVIYEMHIGTFTEEGSWRAAMGRLRPGCFME